MMNILSSSSNTKIAAGLLLVISTLALAWPLAAPTASAVNAAVRQSKSSIAKLTSWANAVTGYELNVGRRPVCGWLRNEPADYTGDLFCKNRGIENAYQ